MPPMMPPSPSAPPPTRPPPGGPPAPAGGAPADRAAGAMIDRDKAAREALMSSIPQPPPGGYTTAKIVAVCDAVNAAFKAIGADELSCKWAAPKGMPKWAQSFPPDVYLRAMALIQIAVKLLGPKGAALAIDPESFATDKGLDTVVKALAALAKDKKLVAALHEAAESASGTQEPPEMEKPKEEEEEPYANDPSLAGVPGRPGA